MYVVVQYFDGDLDGGISQCISERERVIGVHERRSFFPWFVIDRWFSFKLNADLNAIGKSTVIGPINHKSLVSCEKYYCLMKVR